MVSLDCRERRKKSTFELGFSSYFWTALSLDLRPSLTADNELRRKKLTEEKPKGKGVSHDWKRKRRNRLRVKEKMEGMFVVLMVTRHV